MAKNLARILDSDMPRLPLRKAAEQLRKKGRGRDTILAHITPREAARLKAEGGSGTINPDTGLPEFEETYVPSGMDWNIFGEAAPASSAIEPSTQTSFPITQIGSQADAQNLQQDYLSQVASGQAAPGQNLGEASAYPGYFAQQAELQGAIPPYGYTGQTPTEIPQPIAPPWRSAQPSEFASLAGAGTDVPKLTGESQAQPEEQALGKGDREVKAPGAPGTVKTPFGTLNTKDLIAALGIGGLGLNYLNAQNQGKSAAAQLKAAYDTAAQQQMQQAQPFMQQGGQQLGQALTGALSPAQQQQLAAAQAQAAQSSEGRGGAGAAQAGRSIEDLRQRLLANQQTMALQLLGAGTPLIGQAIQNQLSGTTTGINTQMALSQQAGQAATGMLGMLAMMYGRSA
jgi:hypothetical protein